VSENFAGNFGVGPGDVIRLSTPGGVRTLPIAATATNYNGDQGSIMMTRALFVELFGDDRMDYVLVRAAPGADLEAVRAALVERWGEAYQLSVFTNADLRRDILARIDRAFLPASSLFALALVVGCFGIANSLQVALTERVREIGVLRSLGSRRRDVTRLIVTEAGVLGLLGALLGLALGLALSYLWVAIHVRHFLGWIIDYHFALAGCLVGVGAALVTAPLAGWFPARRAARMSPVEALAHE
jgi:putative ABC transport system permease protein